MKHIMVDLETLGRHAGCKILSIGAVEFGPRGLGAEFYVRVLRDQQGDLHEDPDTVRWWSEQADVAKAELFASDEGKLPLAAALVQFNDWLVRLGDKDEKGQLKVGVWGNGADFDNAILNVASAEVGVRQAWPFWGNRCYRTLKGLRPAIKLARVGTYHNALDDAKSQAEHAVRIMQELNAW